MITGMDQPGLQRVFEDASQEIVEITNSYRFADRIKVVKHGPIYWASVTVPTRPGSPYRSFGMSCAKIVYGFGLSDKAAARRCSDRRLKIARADDAWWADRRKRSTYFSDKDVR
jgi:hypothetical protein